MPHLGAARPAADLDPPVQLEEGLHGGGTQLAFHVRAGNYDTDSLIDVLGEQRRFLGGEKATLVWMGCQPIPAAPCAPG